MRVYSREQLLHLYRSPLVQLPPHMPELEQWFSTPIHTLPEDVLIDIFLLYSSPFIKNLKELTLAQTRVRLVCSHWNEIITNNPKFWSHIHVLARSGPQSVSRPPPTDALVPYIERSAQAPLNISLEISSTTLYDTNEKNFMEYWRLLQRSIDRWHQVAIKLSSHSMMRETTRLQLGSLAEAKALVSLSVKIQATSKTTVDILQGARTAPALRHLDWIPCEKECAKLLLDTFPLHNLAEVSLGRQTSMEQEDLRHATQVLRKCTAVRYLRICDSRHQSYSIPSSPMEILPLPLPHLLIAELVLAAELFTFILSIDAPQLSMFSLEIAGDLDLDLSLLTSFIGAHVSRSLEVVVVKYLPINDLVPFLNDTHVSKLYNVEVLYGVWDLDNVKNLIGTEGGGKIRIQEIPETEGQTISVGWRDESKDHATDDLFAKLPPGYHLNVFRAQSKYEWVCMEDEDDDDDDIFNRTPPWLEDSPSDWEDQFMLESDDDMWGSDNGYDWEDEARRLMD